MKQILIGANDSTPDLTGEKAEHTPMFRLSINFGDETNEASRQAVSNAAALERFVKLAQNGYYFTFLPKTSRYGEAYFWAIATKRGEDREEFSLRVNSEILNEVFAALTGKDICVSAIDADALEDFNSKVQNFELELYRAEKDAGRTMKKSYSVTGQTFSSFYKNGVVVYKPYLNPAFKEFLMT